MANETILITGASSDIGCALVRQLLARPEPLLILAHGNSAGGRLAQLKEEFGDAIELFTADFSQAAAVTAMAEQIMAAYGAPASVVHLPALRPSPIRFTKFDLDHFQRDMAVQVQSIVILLKLFLPKMAKMPRARVVFILSSYVHGVAPKYMTMYTTVKYAQLGLMRSLAAEYAAGPVRINAISPSMVETQFLSDLAEVAVQMSAAANPLGRNATPADLLGAIELLLSPASDYMQGVTIPIAAGTAV